MLSTDMPSVNDPEGAATPPGFPPVVDAHVHISPHRISAAIWKWFDENAWQIRYQMRASRVFEFLLSRGVAHIIALQYAHKPGIARALNEYMSEKCAEFGQRVTGMATVFPGEDQAEKILQAAFDGGLGGLKLHAHVQCFDMNADYMNQLYDCCRNNNKPVVMHIGREPKSSAYRCDPYVLCRADKMERVLKDFPDVKFCVPHLGLDELTAYRKLIEKYNNIWLDTTMAITDYFPVEDKIALGHYRSDRIMYGSDFPNIPYAWDRELKELDAVNIPRRSLEMISHQNAIEFFSIDL